MCQLASPQRGGTPKPGVAVYTAHPGLPWAGHRHSEGVPQQSARVQHGGHSLHDHSLRETTIHSQAGTCLPNLYILPQEVAWHRSSCHTSIQPYQRVLTRMALLPSLMVLKFK